MMVDSGASDHYVDDKLVPWIKSKMINLQEINPAREITTAGMHMLYGTATGDIVCKVTDSDGKERTANIPIVIVPGIGKHLFSSGSAKSRGIKTIIGDSPRLEKDNMHFPLREDGRLSSRSTSRFYLDGHLLKSNWRLLQALKTRRNGTVVLDISTKPA